MDREDALELAAVKKEVKRLRERLQISPFGDDKIDELEQAVQFVQHEITLQQQANKCLRRRLADTRDRLVDLAQKSDSGPTLRAIADRIESTLEEDK